MIEKVTSCGQTFAALSSIGDVFTFSLPNPAEDVSKDGRDRHVTVKPQLIWALRKSFTAVKVGKTSWFSADGRTSLWAPTAQLSSARTVDTSSFDSGSSRDLANSSSGGYRIFSERSR
jgi:hypothetical protein